MPSCQATPKNYNHVLHFARRSTSNWCFWEIYNMKIQQPLNEQQHSSKHVAYDISQWVCYKITTCIVEGKEHHTLLRGLQKWYVYELVVAFTLAFNWVGEVTDNESYFWVWKNMGL